ncbi:MAG: thioredoxin domain-containing protein [Nanoarchaeota archaeon]
MVLCLIALPVFALLSIFSIRYRQLTIDALDCLFSTVQFKPCGAKLDDRIKANLTGKIFRFSPKVGGFFFRNYKAFSWAFFLLFLGSIVWSGIGIYNYIEYGNCNGPDSNGICIFDPLGEQSGISTCDQDQFPLDSQAGYNFTLPRLEADDPIVGDPQARLTIIEFGCFSCEWTKKAEPVIAEVLAHYSGKVNLQFKTFFIPNHALSYESSLASDCANEQGKFEAFAKLLFQNLETLTNSSFLALAQQAGLDTARFGECMASQRYKAAVEADTLMGVHAGVQGTPTFFINGRKVTGPKPFRTFQTIIDEELKKV